MNTTTATPATAAEFVTAILDARRDAHRAARDGRPTDRAAAERRSYRLDDAAAAAGFNSRHGVNVGNLDLRAGAEVFGPTSEVGRAYTAMTGQIADHLG